MKTAVLGLMGPVGWTAVAVTALSTAFWALTEWLETDEFKKAKEDVKNLKTATDELTKSVRENNEQHKDNLKDIKESGKANEQLAQGNKPSKLGKSIGRAKSSTQKEN